MSNLKIKINWQAIINAVIQAIVAAITAISVTGCAALLTLLTDIIV